jgi:hypothetical protein
MVFFYIHLLAIVIVAATLGRTALASAEKCGHASAKTNGSDGASLEQTIAGAMPTIIKMLAIGAGIAAALRCVRHVRVRAVVHVEGVVFTSHAVPPQRCHDLFREEVCELPYSLHALHVCWDLCGCHRGRVHRAAPHPGHHLCGYHAHHRVVRVGMRACVCVHVVCVRVCVCAAWVRVRVRVCVGVS